MQGNATDPDKRSSHPSTRIRQIESLPCCDHAASWQVSQRSAELQTRESEDVAREVLVFDDGGDLLADVLGVHDDDLFVDACGLALDDGER